MIRSRAALSGVIVAVLCAGCTASAGNWFGEISPTLSAEFIALQDRETRDGFQKLSSELEMELTRAEITVATVQLLEPGSGDGGSAGGSFDPGSPPPGYSLCHNGHCHADSGALVDYEDIILELQGGGSGTAPRVVLSLSGATLDLLDPENVRPSCDPGCGLDEGNIRQLTVAIQSIQMEGRVRDSLATPRFEGTRDWAWTPQASDGSLPVLRVPVELPIGDEHDPLVDLRVGLTLDAKTFDRVAFEDLAAKNTNQTIQLNNTKQEEIIVQGIVDDALRVNIRRSK